MYPINSQNDPTFIDYAWARAALLNAGAKWTKKDTDLLDKVADVSESDLPRNQAMDSKLKLIERTFTQAKDSSSIWRAVKHFFALHFGRQEEDERDLCVLGSKKNIAETVCAIEEETDPIKKEWFKEKLEYLNLSKDEQIDKIAILKSTIRRKIDDWYSSKEINKEQDIVQPTMKLAFIQGKEISSEEINRQLDRMCTKKWLFEKLGLTENPDEERARKIYELTSLNNHLEEKEVNIMEILKFQRLSKEQQDIVRENLLETLGFDLYQLSCAQTELLEKGYKRDSKIVLSADKIKKHNKDLDTGKETLKQYAARRGEPQNPDDASEEELKDKVHTIEAELLNSKINQLNDDVKKIKTKLEMLSHKLSDQEMDKLTEVTEEYTRKLDKEAEKEKELNVDLAAIAQFLPAIAASKSAYSTRKEAFLGKYKGEYYSVSGVSFDGGSNYAPALKEAETVIQKSYDLHKIDRDKYIELMTYVSIISEGKNINESITEISKDLIKERVEEDILFSIQQRREIDNIQKDLDSIEEQIAGEKRLSGERKIEMLKKQRSDLESRRNECQRVIVKEKVELYALLDYLERDYLKKKVDEYARLENEVQNLANQSELKGIHMKTVEEYRYKKDLYQELLDKKREQEAIHRERKLKFKNRLRSRHRI